MYHKIHIFIVYKSVFLIYSQGVQLPLLPNSRIVSSLQKEIRRIKSHYLLAWLKAPGKN